MHNDLQKPKSKWLSQFEILLLGATAIVSGLVALLDFLGALDGIPWLSDRIPTLTLLAMGMVAAYLVVERRNYLDAMQDNSDIRINELEQAIESSTKTIVQSLDGVEFRRFESGDDLLKYVIKRMSQARKTIDDLSWSPAVSLRQELEITQQLNQQYTEQVFKASKKLQYREVFIFSRPGRIEKLQRRLEENFPGYSCAYYPLTDIPLLQFMIIDNEEIFILSDQFLYYYTIKHPDLLKLFSRYYEDVWKKATPLKLNKNIIHEEVEKVLAHNGKRS
ncbi:MAG: hypothetical protein H6667_10025 [Ardenticatenaceae bacterium]|nr:hypothetical protein [Ardenticatenaceae bacterium]